MFSSLHTSVGMAFVGAVVGEYLGSAKGVGYLILQAEGVFDINTVIAGIVVLTVFALLLDFIVTKIEARLLVWRPRTARDRGVVDGLRGGAQSRAVAAVTRRRSIDP